VTGRLREQLQRIGEAAPVAAVPGDTWARARRARRRDGLLGAAAAAAVLALLAGTVGGLPGSDRPPVAAGRDGGVPGHVWAVPERMAAQDNGDHWTRDEVTSDLAVGPAGAAYVMREGLPVVVGAGDGAYHLLDLPGFLGRGLLERTGLGTALGLALSPDGTQLAYAWSGPAPDSDADPMPSGVRVADLRTGEVRTVRLHGGRGVMVGTIAWSPDSRWLVWSGQLTSYWTATSYTAHGTLAGRIAPGATTSQPVPSPTDSATQYAVSEDGEVAAATTNALVRWTPDRTVRTPVRAGTTVPVWAGFVGERLTTLRVRDTRFIHELTGAGAGTRFPPGLTGQRVQPLGWLDGTHLAARTGPPDQPAGDLVLVTVGDHPAYSVVGGVDDAVPDTLTVAVDLMAPDRPTVERAEPDWPWSEERWILTVGLGLLGLALVAALARLRRGRLRSR
jgi:hypothetical protein